MAELTHIDLNGEVMEIVDESARKEQETHETNKDNPHGVTAELIGAVPTSRTVNGKALSANIKLSASDVSAVPTSRTVNGKALSTNITLSASDVSADASGTATSKVSQHNTNSSAHSDIRDLITTLTTRLNALANSDDTTLDQMSEIVAYIKSNRSLIESITTDKVNVADIIDNLTTSVSTKPLSAKQGVALKTLIDTLQTSLGSAEMPYPSSSVTYNISQLNSEKAPNNHASAATTYGAGNTASYGHVKLVNNLNEAAYAAGLALSANQGYVLNTKITEVTETAANTASDASNYLTNISANTPTISSSGYVSTTDASSFARYYKVGIMTCVQVSLLVTKEIPALTSINLVTGLPAAAVSTPDFLHDLHGKSYSVQIDTNGVNLHTYAYHQEPIPVNTRLIGTLWYRRKTL